jgi:pSer/pThr/pTyr-binding forkhead associated (FHA) protein
MHKLIIEDDEGRATVVPLIRDELTIGRMEGNAIRLTERNVSRKHARLFRQGDALYVEDLGSYTGVRINGARIDRPTALCDGDHLTIGDYKLAIRAEIRDAAGAAPAAGAGATTTGGLSPRSGAPSAGHGGDDTDLLSTREVPVHAALAGDPVVPPAGAPAPEGVARQALDASPTIPLHTLAEDPAVVARGAAGTAAARLVVVTSALAGHEFVLNRPSLVIGRTQENDIVLNHPSISRHHAKVIRDGDRYTVVDLQSANGVRVAGESYERVDVQPGDVLELGHVKLRFVGPRESWSFDPREFAPRSRRGLKLAALALGASLAVALVVFLRDKKPTPEPALAPAVVVLPKPAEPEPTTLLAEARSASEAEDWDRAVTILDLLLGRPTTDAVANTIRPEVTNLKRKVDSERRAKDLLASFEQAVDAREPDVALSRFDEIPPDSLYKARAEPKLAGIKAQFLTAHLELAEAAGSQGHCDDARGEVEKIQQVDPENKRAVELVKKCRPRGASKLAIAAVVNTGQTGPSAAAGGSSASAGASTTTAVVGAALAGTTPRAGAPAQRTPKPAAAKVVAARSNGVSASGEPTTALESDAADLIRQAREAWSRQQCPSAIDLSRRALRLRPGSIEAHQIMAVCSCSGRDRDGALKSYVRLDERSREMVRTLCGRYGVELGE